MTKTEKTQTDGLYRKISALRADICQMDWEPDKLYTVGSSVVRFISADKVKRMIAPLLVKHGLEMELNYYDLKQEAEIPRKPFHWSVKLDVSLIDIDTGDRTVSTVYGESSTMDDKGISMVETVALRRYFEQKFLIADWLDDSKNEGGAFTKRTGAETEDVKSKILDKGVEPPSAVPAPATVPAPAPAAVPAPAPVQVPAPSDKPRSLDIDSNAPAKTDAVPAPAGNPDKPAYGHTEALRVEDLPEDVTTLNRNMIGKMVADWNLAGNAGTVSEESYDAFYAGFCNISDNVHAAAFIKKFRKVA